MVNELILPEGMNVVPGTNDYGTLFENNIVDGEFKSNGTNWVEYNNMDFDSYWKTKVFDKMYSDDMKVKHRLAIVSEIMRDPGNTGGNECVDEVNEAKNAIMFTGKIDWYEEDKGLGRIAGNRVGVMIKFPDEVTEEQLNTLKIHIAGKVYGKDALDEHEGKKVLWYYPLVKSNEDSFKVSLVWGEETNNQDFWIFISPTTELKEAEVATEEKVSKKA